MTTLVQQLIQTISGLLTRTGTVVVDFGATPSTTATKTVAVGVVDGLQQPRAGCVTAQIALGQTTDHTESEHTQHALTMTVLCGTPDTAGNVQIVISSSVARTGKYLINIQRIV